MENKKITDESINLSIEVLELFSLGLKPSYKDLIAGLDSAIVGLRELQIARQRIAELEARTVKLPEPISVLHRRDFNDAHRAIYAYPEAEVDAALAAAGIGKGE